MTANELRRAMRDGDPKSEDPYVDTIVGWLREQAQARGLPFLDAAGRLLVRLAISNARRAAARA